MFNSENEAHTEISQDFTVHFTRIAGFSARMFYWCGKRNSGATPSVRDG